MLKGGENLTESTVNQSEKLKQMLSSFQQMNLIDLSISKETIIGTYKKTI